MRVLGSTFRRFRAGAMMSPASWDGGGVKSCQPKGISGDSRSELRGELGGELGGVVSGEVRSESSRFMAAGQRDGAAVIRIAA